MIIAQTHDPQIQEWMRTALTAAGALSLVLGYRLFCGEKATRAALITNLLSGALLAVFGVAILVTGARPVHKTPARSTQPAWQHKSLEPANTRGRIPLIRLV